MVTMIIFVFSLCLSVLGTSAQEPGYTPVRDTEKPCGASICQSHEKCVDTVSKPCDRETCTRFPMCVPITVTECHSQSCRDEKVCVNARCNGTEPCVIETKCVLKSSEDEQHHCSAEKCRSGEVCYEFASSDCKDFHCLKYPTCLVPQELPCNNVTCKDDYICVNIRTECPFTKCDNFARCVPNADLCDENFNPALNPKPRFDPCTPATITANVGSRTKLPCKVFGRENRTVEWLRNGDSIAWSMGPYGFSSDDRFLSSYDYHTHAWELIITEVQRGDEGSYECQVATPGKISHFVQLNLVENRSDCGYRNCDEKEVCKTVFECTKFECKKTQACLPEHAVTCGDVQCNPGTSCSLITSDYCLSPTCYAVPQCLFKNHEKNGTCPAVDSKIGGACMEQCAADGECSGSLKCCSNGCGHVCTEPMEPGQQPRLCDDNGNVTTTDSETHFDPCLPKVVTVKENLDVNLPCRVFNLKNNTVSWIRNNDSHVLSVGVNTFPSGLPFQVVYNPEESSWTLQMRRVQFRAAGSYECRISTAQKMSRYVQLNVVENDDKEGTCALLISTSINSTCRDQCLSDGECSGDLKCCSSGCRNICAKPNNNKTLDPCKDDVNLSDTVDADSSTPQFDPCTPANITAVIGSTAKLPCRVFNLGSKVVSWIRDRDHHILTLGLFSYTTDYRFTALNQPSSHNWMLRILYVNSRDTGTYRCEVYTSGETLSRLVHLNVVDPCKDGENLSDSVDADSSTPQFDPCTPTNITAVIGSTAKLPCRVFNLGSKVVSWIRDRDNRILTFGLFSYTTDDRFRALHQPSSHNWMLQILYVNSRDTGTYLCDVNTSEEMLNRLVHLNVVEKCGDVYCTADQRCELTYQCLQSGCKAYNACSLTNDNQIWRECRHESCNPDGLCEVIQECLQSECKSHNTCVPFKSADDLVCGDAVCNSDEQCELVYYCTEPDCVGHKTCLPKKIDTCANATCKECRMVHIRKCVMPPCYPDPYCDEVHSKVQIRLGPSLNSSNIHVGDDVYFECYTASKLPSATITWKHNDIRLDHDIVNGVIIFNETLIIQNLKRSQEGVYECSAEGDGHSEVFNLTIQLHSKVQIRLGPSLNSSNIHVGDDVYFECYIPSKLPSATITWKHNDTRLDYDIVNGVITFNETLIIQNLKRSQEGVYDCSAEGVGRSEVFNLTIQ